MQGLVDSLVQSTDSPKAVITTGGRTLGTATSVGGAGVTVWFSIFYPNPLKYTDPDGREDEIPIIDKIFPNGLMLPGFPGSSPAREQAEAEAKGYLIGGGLFLGALGASASGPVVATTAGSLATRFSDKISSFINSGKTLINNAKNLLSGGVQGTPGPGITTENIQVLRLFITMCGYKI